MRSPGRCVWTEKKISGPKLCGDSNAEIRKMRGVRQGRLSTCIWEGGKATSQVKKLFQGEGTEQWCQMLLGDWRVRTGTDHWM